MANNVNRTITTTLKLAGEAEYKNQLKQINAESKNLDASMKELKTRFDGNTESAEYLAEKQKILAEEMKNAEAKVKVLKDAYSEAKEEEQRYADKAAELREKLDNLKKTEGDTSEEQKELNEKLRDAEEQAQRAANTAQQYDTRIKNAQASVNGFANEQKKLNDELNGGSKAAEEAGEKNVKLGGSFDVASAGATALISTGIIKFFNELREELNETIKGAANYADEMNTLSAQYGVSTHDLQVFAYASELVDVDLNTMTSSLSRNVRAMKSAQDGTASCVDAYKKLGVSVTNADGSLRDSEEVYWEVIDALGKMENKTEADSIAMTLMGRSAMQLNPLIKVGKEGMEAYAKQAEEAGAVLSDDVLDTLNKLQDAEDTQAANLDALKNQLGSTLAPELTQIKEAEAELLKNLTEFIKNNPELVKTITAVLGAISSLIAVKLAYTAITKTLTALHIIEAKSVDKATASYGALNTTMLANPYALLIGALAALTASMVYLAVTTETAEEKYQKLLNTTNEYTAALDKSNSEIKQNYDGQLQQLAATETLIKRYDELNNATKLSESEQTELNIVVEKLKAVYSGLDWQLDSTTGRYKVLTSEIEASRKAMQRQIETNYYYDVAQTDFATMQSTMDKIRETAQIPEFYFNKSEIDWSSFTDYKKLEESMSAADLSDRSKYSDEDILVALKLILSRKAETPSPYSYYDWKQAAKTKELQDLYDAYIKAKSGYNEYLDLFSESAANTPSAPTSSGSTTPTPSRAAKSNNNAQIVSAVLTALRNKYAEAAEDEKELISQSIANIEKWRDAQVGAIQEQIASLDALSKKEQEESKSAELLQKAQELEFRARAEKDDYQRAELEKQANAARKDLEDYEKSLERAATKAELQSEIAQIKEIAEAQKAEALAQQTAITERYGALTSSGSLNEAATALLKGNKSDLVSLLASYNPDYFTNESTFASGLGAALSASYLQSVLSGARKQISAAVNPADTSGASAGILARSVQIGEVNINTSGASTAAEAQDLFEQFANKLADALS